MTVVTATSLKTLADRIEDLLPQTQCTKCGYPACRPYAEAIAAGEANYNQCPPGGQEGVVRLASLLGMPIIALTWITALNGHGRLRSSMRIFASDAHSVCRHVQSMQSLGLRNGSSIIPELCTGCDLCVPPCPVDCIAMVPVTGEKTGWDAWSQQEADAARERHDLRLARLARERNAAEARKAARMAGWSGTDRIESLTEPRIEPNTQPAGSVESKTEQPGATPLDDAQAKKRAIIQAAMDRARQKKEELARLGAGPKTPTRSARKFRRRSIAAEARPSPPWHSSSRRRQKFDKCCRARQQT